MAEVTQAGFAGTFDWELSGFGVFLRCETCRRMEELGSPGRRIAGGQGWPKCCGYTMRWWTQRQIDAGEVPS